MEKALKKIKDNLKGLNKEQVEELLIKNSWVLQPMTAYDRLNEHERYHHKECLETVYLSRYNQIYTTKGWRRLQKIFKNN